MGDAQVIYLEEQLEDTRADCARFRRERDVFREILVAASGPEPDEQRLKEIFRAVEAAAE